MLDVHDFPLVLAMFSGDEGDEGDGESYDALMGTSRNRTRIGDDDHHHHKGDISLSFSETGLRCDL